MTEPNGNPKKEMSVVIATPFYSVHGGVVPYIKSIAQTTAALAKSGISFAYWQLPGDTYLDRARNTLANRFMESDFTDLFFIDGDIEWDVDGFAAVLRHNRPIVGGTYRMKNDADRYAGSICANDDKTPVVDPETGLIRAVGVPTGFMKIKKAVFKGLSLWSEMRSYKDKGADPTDPDRDWFDFFGTHYEDGFRFGDDMAFCRRCLKMGIEMWIEPRVTLTHHGFQGWKGNFHDYLLPSEPEKTEEPDHVLSTAP